MSGLERHSFGRWYWSVWSLLQDCVVFVWKNWELGGGGRAHLPEPGAESSLSGPWRPQKRELE